ncbi:MAG: hypothetical protein R3245_02775 [Kiloniellales bacterium]|nr:hypothetical protein [Kiloniellales bacterium]
MNADLAAWADMIFVMEARQRKRIRKKFKQRPPDHRIITLHIPGEFERDQPELIELLEQKVPHLLENVLRIEM